jgi:hypothetical protein
MNDNLAHPPIQRYKMWGMCLVSLGLTIALIRFVKVAVGIDAFSLTLWGFVPVGAMVAAAAAASGYMLYADSIKWPADLWDLLFLMVACLTLQVLLVAVDYWAVLLARPQLSGRFSYAQFFADSLTQVEYTARSRQYGTARPQKMGESGWIMLLPRIGGMLATAKVIHGNFGRTRVYPAF